MAYTDSTPGTVTGALLVILVMLPCFILNILFLVMYGKRSRLRIPTNYMFINLCVVDFVALIGWTVFAVLSALTSTASPTLLASDTTICTMQVIVSTFYQLMNMHTFAIFSIERVLRFWKPTLHAEVFYNDVAVIVMLLFLWILELVVSLVPVYGWGTVLYQEVEFQCSFDNTKVASRMNALFIYNYGIPFLFTFICFICVFKKYSDLKRGIHPGSEDLDDDMDYGDKYKGNQNDLSTRGNSRSGYSPNGRDSGFEDSDDETDYNRIVSVIPIEDEDQAQLCGKTAHKYRLRDYELALTVFIIWWLFIILWLIYIAVHYIYVYNTALKTTLPDAVATAAMFLSHFSLVMKYIIYFGHNRRFRFHLRAALGCVAVAKPKPKKQVNVLRIPTEPAYARRNAGGPKNMNIYRQQGAPGMNY